MKGTEELIKNAPLFEKLTKEELSLVAGIGHSKTYVKEEVIFLEGEAFAVFSIVLEGEVKVYKLGADGNETLLHLLRPYKSFAETPLFTSSDVYPACAETTVDSILYYVPKVEFKRVMEESSSLTLKITEAFASRLMELNRKFGQFSVNVEKRLARYIMNEVDLNGSLKSRRPAFVLSMAKKELAGQLGIAVETLSRNLRKLKDNKIVREEGDQIIVIDPVQLRKLSE